MYWATFWAIFTQTHLVTLARMHFPTKWRQFFLSFDFTRPESGADSTKVKLLKAWRRGSTVTAVAS
jgi:hypothetical protein